MSGYVLFRLLLGLMVPIGFETVALWQALNRRPTQVELFGRGELFLIAFALLVGSAELLWRGRRRIMRMLGDVEARVHQRIFFGCVVLGVLTSALVALLWAGTVEDVVRGEPTSPEWLPTSGGMVLLALVAAIGAAFAFYASREAGESVVTIEP